MWKKVRELQPAHKSHKFTVAEAARAFRQVRGAAPMASILDDDAIVRRDASGRLMVDPNSEPAADVAPDVEKASARQSPARGRIAYRKGVLRYW